MTPSTDYGSLYSGPVRTKTDAYDDWNAKYHHPFYGLMLQEVVFNGEYSTESIIGYGDYGDSSIWTGTYLASQSWRYFITKDPKAKENAIRSANALHGCHRITGKKGYIARYYGPVDSLAYRQNKNDDHLHIVNSGTYKGDFWTGHTSKDQYTGWFLGMSVAYDLIDDPPTQEMIRADLADVVSALIDQGWKILNSEGKVASWSAASFPPNQFKLAWTMAAFHATGNPKFRAELQSRLSLWRRPWMLVQSASFYHKYSKYYPFNLEHTAYFIMLRLGKAYFSPTTYTELSHMFSKWVHNYIQLSHNPWFNGIYMTIGEYVMGGNEDPHHTQLREDLTDFQSCPRTSYALPERAPGTYTLDSVSKFLKPMRAVVLYIISIFPDSHDWNHFWGNLLTVVVSEKAFRIPEQCMGGFQFQDNPYLINACGSDNKWVVNSGTDYLTAYWLARFHNYVSNEL